MEIKPTYATFEQAKKLKEKGFDIITRTAYDFRIYKPSNVFEENIEIINNAKNYSNSEYERFQRPEQWQVVEWLRVNHGIFISCEQNYKGEFWTQIHKKSHIIPIWEVINAGYSSPNSPQEAYSSAFDYIFKNLI